MVNMPPMSGRCVNPADRAAPTLALEHVVPHGICELEAPEHRGPVTPVPLIICELGHVLGLRPLDDIWPPLVVLPGVLISALPAVPILRTEFERPLDQLAPGTGS